MDIPSEVTVKIDFLVDFIAGKTGDFIEAQKVLSLIPDDVLNQYGIERDIIEQFCSKYAQMAENLKVANPPSFLEGNNGSEVWFPPSYYDEV